MAETKHGQAAAFDEVARSARALAAESRRIIEDAGGVAEKELGRLLSAAESSRDGLLQMDALQSNRERPLFKSLKLDAHRAVDIGFDAIVTLYAFATETVEKFVDEPMQGRRPKS